MSSKAGSCNRGHPFGEAAASSKLKKSIREPKGGGTQLQGLWACRMAAGVTQRALAKSIGTSQHTIHALESQERGAYPGTITKLCEVLEVAPVGLILGSPHE